MTKGKKLLYPALFTVTALIYILLFPYETAFYTKSALSMCAASVIPSLFLFMVFSRILAKLCSAGFMSGKISRFFSKLFGLPVCLVPICLTGIVCGAPACTVSVCRLYSDGYCSKDDAERACILTGNSSCAFITGVVSSTLGSRYSAAYILISSLASTLTVYMLLYRHSVKSSEVKVKKNDFNIFDAVSDSIASSASAVLTLSAYVVFFYTVGGIVSSKIASALQAAGLTSDYVNIARTLICSLFEIGLGLNSVNLISGTKAILLCAIAVSFTGISIIFQVTGIMRQYGISIKNYIFSKILCAFLCQIYLTTILLTTPFPVSVFAYSEKSQNQGFSVSDAAILIFVTAVVFAAARILSHLDKKHKK